MVIGAIVGAVLGIVYCWAKADEPGSIYHGQYYRILSGILVGTTTGALIGYLFFRGPPRLDE